MCSSTTVLTSVRLRPLSIACPKLNLLMLNGNSKFIQRAIFLANYKYVKRGLQFSRKSKNYSHSSELPSYARTLYGPIVKSKKSQCLQSSVQYFCTTSRPASRENTFNKESKSTNCNKEDSVLNASTAIETECSSLNDREDDEEKQVELAISHLFKLTIDQRREILSELQLESAAERKKEAEEKLASWHWRSKFGRPTSIHPSKVDPSGTYCEIPQDWLINKVAENAKVKPPAWADIRRIAVYNALPFVGFGFLDNVIMIVAGDYIDLTIGTYLGISTMAAAALGNTISDLAGIGSAWYVEFLTNKVGLHPPDLTPQQQEMPSVRWSANIGRGVGVCVGCILGMFPLLFLTTHPRKDKDKDKGKDKDKEEEESKEEKSAKPEQTHETKTQEKSST